MSAAAASVKTVAARKSIEQLKSQPLPESKNTLRGLEAAICAGDRLAVVCHCSQSASKGRGQSLLSYKEKKSEEDRSVISEKAISDFLQASIDFEATQNRKTKHSDI